MREFFVVDKDYYFGKYAPLIILIPHSRIRTQSSLLFDSAFQILTTLNLVSTNEIKPLAEHSSNKYKSQRDRQKELIEDLLPRKVKNIEKQIVHCNTSKFISSPIENLDFNLGFEALRRQNELNWHPDWF